MKPIAVAAAALLASAWMTGSNAEPLGAQVASAASDWLVLADLSTTNAEATPVGSPGGIEIVSPLPFFVTLSGSNHAETSLRIATAGLDGHVIPDGRTDR